MLKKFSVSNFKCFKDKITLDLGSTNGYSFNPEAIENGIVKAGIIYGHNASGKSNLALAIFDITRLLTDFQHIDGFYNMYLNADNFCNTAEFEYVFKFDDMEVIYRYGKNDYNSIQYEYLNIGGKEVVISDRQKNTDENPDFFCILAGTESLKKNVSQPSLSVLKFIRNNSELKDNAENKAFNRLFDFVESMLFFKSLDHRLYLGKAPKTNDLLESIINAGLVKDYENFMNEIGINCRLTVIDKNNGKTIAREFNTGKTIEIHEIWSTGTSNLTLFYCWYQQVLKNNVKFLFIDEFDAFYHFDISRIIINLLKKSDVQFLLTTHNTANMTNSLLRPDCYFLLNKQGITSLSKLTEKELREAHNIEKMYKAGSFNG